MLFLFYCICNLLFVLYVICFFFFFKQKTAYEMRISDWSSDVCSSDLGNKQELRAISKSIKDLPDVHWPAEDLIRNGNAVIVDNLNAYLSEIPNSYWPERSEERRVGKECVSKCRSRW